ncbi:hypothetical protein FHL15_010655 [Xylaria flabelliformis]|uniref:Infection structure specific protein n=1 Tax=Xylaria flabelliformis TaxID=2512241 RepID=A0A553HKI6_9PEZI|nr:hypothetical protein FHL15_010655 [Xylaria flabelliformis]
MYSNKVLMPLAALAGASVAQTVASSICDVSKSGLMSGGPTVAPELEPYLGTALGGSVGASATSTSGSASTTEPPTLLSDPEKYVNELCSIAATLPSSLLSDYQSFGAALLAHGSSQLVAYDNYVTDCITTGTAAASITSYLNSILTGTDPLCQATSTPVTSAASYPVATPTGYNSTTNSTTTSIPTAAAARPASVVAGAVAMGGLIGAAILM